MMEIVNGVLSGVMVVLAVLVAGIVVLWCLCRVLDGMALAFTGTRLAFAASGRLFEAVRRAVLYVRHRKWRPEWKARERKAWEEELNARKRREHQEMLARIDALKKSQRV